MRAPSSLLVRMERDGSWQVWIGAPGEHPATDPCGFIIGLGHTRDEAVSAAVADLEAALDLLQAPPGVVPEEHETSHGMYLALATPTGLAL